MAARVRAGWIERAAPVEATEGDERRRRRAEEARDCGARRERAKTAARERTCVVTGLEGGAGGDAALRAVAARASSTPDIRRKLPGPRRLDAARPRRRAPGGRQTGVCARVSQAASGPSPELADEVDRCSSRTRCNFFRSSTRRGCVVAGAAKVEAAIRAGRARGADSRQRRRARTARQSSTGCSAACSANARIGVATNKSLRVASIGFGIGEVKCDTCSAQRGAGERGLPRQGRAPDPIPGGRGGVDGGCDRGRRGRRDCAKSPR